MKIEERVPVILCIDVEPDERAIDPRVQHNWNGFEESFRWFLDLRTRLENGTQSKVNFNWFLRLDPQIHFVYGSPNWPIRHYRQYIDEIVSYGDEIGLHAHAWRWDSTKSKWVIDYQDQEWINYCVSMSSFSYEEAFGRKARCFRFGDRWMNNATVALLESLGVFYDLTIEPGYKAIPCTRPDEVMLGSLPDYSEIPRTPYRPSPLDYKRLGVSARRSLWMIPVSTAQIPSEANTLPAPDDPYCTLNISFDNRVVSHVFDHCLASKNNSPLVIVARTGDIMFEPWRSHFMQNLEYLADHCRLQKLVFTTPAEAVRLYCGTPDQERGNDLTQARETQYQPDLGPLPLIRAVNSIISNRFLTKEGGIEYWSRIYDDGNSICKQATLDLAKREADFLSKFKGSYFPQALDSKLESGYSIVILEKIPGIPLPAWKRDFNQSPTRLQGFFDDCLNILACLKEKGITHRDIRPENILLREDKPVLIDFGWAISDNCPYHTPAWLGGEERPPDRSFSDVFSMGKVFEVVNEGRYSSYDAVTSFMTEKDPSLRIDDLELLRRLFHGALLKVLGQDSSQQSDNDNLALYNILVQHIPARTQRVYWLDEQVRVQNELIQSLSGQIGQKDKELIEFREQVVPAVKLQLEEKDKELIEFREQVVPPLKLQLEEKDKELIEFREQVVPPLKLQLEEKDKELIEFREQVVPPLKLQLEEKDKSLGSLKFELEKTKLEIQGARDRVQKLQKEFDESSALIIQLQAENSTLRQRITELQMESQLLKENWQVVTNSTGWAFLQFAWRMRLRLAPAGSVRERISRKVIRFFRSTQ